MPRIVGDGTFEVYVYANDHNPPHCHLYWDGGDEDAMIDLRNLQVLFGNPKKQGMDLIANNLGVIRSMWNSLNPGKAIP